MDWEGERAADPSDTNSESGLFLRLVKCLPPQSTAQLASLADFFYAVSFHFLHFFPTAEPGPRPSPRLVRKKDKPSFVPLSSMCSEGKQMYEKV